MGQKNNKDFKVRKEEVNKKYAELVKRNFKKNISNDLIDFDIDCHTDSKVVNRIFLDIKPYIVEQLSQSTIAIEKFRVEHIISAYETDVTNRKDLAFNYLNIYVAILCIFIQAWIETLLTLPAILSNLLTAILFAVIIGMFISGAKSISSANEENIFMNDFELLFYRIYLEVLNTYDQWNTNENQTGDEQIEEE